jgi:hypothetical protein
MHQTLDPDPANHVARGQINDCKATARSGIARLQGVFDRADLLIGFSESPEHRGLTADLVPQGFFNTDDDYQTVALLYDTLGRLPEVGG